MFEDNFMISFQDDKLLDSSLRKNSFINIFTTETICNAYFNRSANNFTPQEKKKMAKLANFVFNDPKLKDKNYKKMIHIKDKIPNIYYTIADYVDDFKFGSLHLHQLCNKVKKLYLSNQKGTYACLSHNFPSLLTQQICKKKLIAKNLLTRLLHFFCFYVC